MANHIFTNRVTKELRDLELDPPPGIVCYPIEDSLEHLEAYLDGPSGSPYEGGQFQLDIVLPERYPFEPPRIKYNTPIYHPNIDDQGRICADVLKSSGAWRPSMTLSTTLMSLHTLMADPNPEDPLDADIANEFKMNHELYVSNAKAYTARHASKEARDAAAANGKDRNDDKNDNDDASPVAKTLAASPNDVPALPHNHDALPMPTLPARSRNYKLMSLKRKKPAFESASPASGPASPAQNPPPVNALSPMAVPSPQDISQPPASQKTRIDALSTEATRAMDGSETSPVAEKASESPLASTSPAKRSLSPVPTSQERNSTENVKETSPLSLDLDDYSPARALPWQTRLSPAPLTASPALSIDLDVLPSSFLTTSQPPAKRALVINLVDDSDDDDDQFASAAVSPSPSSHPQTPDHTPSSQIARPMSADHLATVSNSSSSPQCISTTPLSTKNDGRQHALTDTSNKDGTSPIKMPNSPKRHFIVLDSDDETPTIELLDSVPSSSLPRKRKKLSLSMRK